MSLDGTPVCVCCGDSIPLRRKDVRYCKKQSCQMAKQREWRAANKAKHLADRRKWRRTVNGRIHIAYHDMRVRVEGRSSDEYSRNLYSGLPIVSKHEFVAWSAQDAALQRLHRDWASSGYDHTLVPSIDRIDSTKGYVFGNMRWVTKSANSFFAAQVRWSKAS